MPTTYQKGSKQQAEQLDELVKHSFPELCQARVNITFMVASNEDGEAIKVHGCPAAAKIKINSLADRAEGKGDATVTVDDAAWNDLSARQQEALLFHELTHLAVVRTGEDKVKRDDLGRPKLKMRHDDWNLNGFFECIERYGHDAYERRTLGKLTEVLKQKLLWDYLDVKTKSA